jgi:hypothetical protein
VALHGRFTMTRTEIDEATTRLRIPPPVTLPPVAGTVARRPSGVVAGLGVEPEMLSDVLGTLAQPDALLLAHRLETGGLTELRLLAVSARWTVEQTAGPFGQYDFELWDGGTVVERVVAWCRLQPRPPAAGRPCELSGRAWLDVLALAAEDPGRAVRILRWDGVGADAAEPLVAAAAGRRRTVQVTTLHRPTLRRLEGTTVGWIDGGDAGLWEVAAPKLATSGDYGRSGSMLIEAVQIRLTPTTVEGLVAEIVRGFPPGVT